MKGGWQACLQKMIWIQHGSRSSVTLKQETKDTRRGNKKTYCPGLLIALSARSPPEILKRHGCSDAQDQ